MVEYAFSLDNTFSALADNTRRDILRRVSSAELSVTELARSYNLTYAAVSKHLKVLEQARLIVKRRIGRKHMVSLAPSALDDASEYMEWYSRIWQERLDSLERYLIENKE